MQVEVFKTFCKVIESDSMKDERKRTGGGVQSLQGMLQGPFNVIDSCRCHCCIQRVTNRRDGLLLVSVIVASPLRVVEYVVHFLWKEAFISARTS